MICIPLDEAMLVQVRAKVRAVNVPALRSLLAPVEEFEYGHLVLEAGCKQLRLFKFFCAQNP